MREGTFGKLPAYWPEELVLVVLSVVRQHWESLAVISAFHPHPWLVALADVAVPIAGNIGPVKMHK